MAFIPIMTKQSRAIGTYSFGPVTITDVGNVLRFALDRTNLPGDTGVDIIELVVEMSWDGGLTWGVDHLVNIDDKGTKWCYSGIHKVTFRGGAAAKDSSIQFDAKNLPPIAARMARGTLRLARVVNTDLRVEIL